MEIHTSDVGTAFLCRELSESIYMAQPEGYVVLGYENKMLKLRKSIYGLKQVPKVLYDNLNAFLVSQGDVSRNYESCLYSKTGDSGLSTHLAVYVHNLV
ncbi:unnamed protein product, partial [Heterosigma akashiwo]